MIKKRLFAFSLVLLTLNLLHSQPPMVQIWYETSIGPASTDTVNVYMRSATASPIDIRAVNFSVMFDSTCTQYQSFDCFFSVAWSNFFEQVQLTPFAVTYNSISYNKRFSYGNGDLGPPFSSGPVTLNPVTGPLMKIMSVVFSGTCGQNIVMEDESQNSLNQIGDINNQRLDWELLRINRVLDTGLLGLQAEALDEKEALVFWEMSASSPFDRFVVEKWNGEKLSPEEGFSAISHEITAISNKIPNGNRQYEFIDPDATSRRNVYRLKLIDPNGQDTYSGRVEITRNPQLTASPVQLYPNPTKGKVTFQSQYLDAGNFLVNVFDAMGSQVFSKEIILSNGIPEEIDISSLPAGPYHVMIEDLEGERMVKPIRLVKF